MCYGEVVFKMPRTMDSNTKSYLTVYLNKFLWFFFLGLFKEEWFSVPAYLPSMILSVLVKHRRTSIMVCRPVEMLWIQIQGLCEQKNICCFRKSGRRHPPLRLWGHAPGCCWALTEADKHNGQKLFFFVHLHFYCIFERVYVPLTANGFFVFLTNVAIDTD